MRIFVTNLTLYTYDNEYRRALNDEEVEKFTLGLEYAEEEGSVNEIYVFSDFTREEFEESIKMLSEEERRNFTEMILNPLGYKEKRGVKVKFQRADLTDFDDTYKTVWNTMEHILKSDGKAKIYVNLSCGHKIGALATYIAMTNIRDGCKNKSKKDDCKKKSCTDIVVIPYHAEREVVHFPALNITPGYAEKKYEKFLEVFATPITYDDAKARIMKDLDEKEAEGAIVYLLRKRKLIIKRSGNKYTLTQRGRTLLYLLQSLGEEDEEGR